MRIATVVFLTHVNLVGIALCSTDVFHMPQGQTSLEFVTVGDPYNDPDERFAGRSVGSVGYEYRIGKFEVTAAQYTAFLNAVADDDPYRLYTAPMGGGNGAGILRDGLPGGYVYSVASNYANRPVCWVSIWDAMRFTNWLHNGQPTGAQGPETTEDGAYQLDGHVDNSNGSISRRAGAKYFVPNEDEWYKAAYYEPAGELGGRYFNYPTATNSAPGNDITELTNGRNNANITVLSKPAIGEPYFRTEVGTFFRSKSYYGTFDQGGNVWEWNETTSGGPSSSLRGLRGGSSRDPAIVLHASNQDFTSPAGQDQYIGFRIAAAVPEPSTVGLIWLAIAIAQAHLRTRRSA